MLRLLGFEIHFAETPDVGFFEHFRLRTNFHVSEQKKCPKCPYRTEKGALN